MPLKLICAAAVLTLSFIPFAPADDEVAKRESQAPQPQISQAPQDDQSAQGKMEQAPEKKPETESSDDACLSEFTDAISALRKDSPGISKKLETGNVRMNMLKAALKVVGVGIATPEPDKPEAKTETKAKLDGESQFFPSMMIGSNKILYLRLSSIDSKSFTKLKEECESAARLRNKPVGLVVDIRECSGGDYKDALHELALFCPDGKLPERPSEKRLFDIPSAVLVGGRTSGAAEVFALLMERSQQGLLIGSQTAGRPFPTKNIEVASESDSTMTLSVPQVPESLYFVDSAPITPSIETQAYPQIPYERLSKSVGSEDSDKCLARAVDLLLCLDALKQKMSK